MVDSTPKQIKIFYADDDPDDAFFFQAAIEEICEDCKLAFYDSGIELLNELNIEKDFHNIIFLDINMPFKNGIECLKEIRNNKGWDTVPVFMISTSDSDELKERSKNFGACDYIEKPSDLYELKNKLKEAIRNSFEC